VTFDALGLSVPLLRAIQAEGFRELTPVQALVLPQALAGEDVFALAPTGTGKTLAFALALLTRLEPAEPTLQALVLCPTRELAEQVGSEIRRAARFLPNLRVVTLCGGVPARAQLRSLERTPQVVVGTPGRLQDHLARGSLPLKDVSVLVLDEADRMLDMGFLPEVEALVAQAPRARQTLLFSATATDAVRAVSRKLQRSAREVTAPEAAHAPSVEQLACLVLPEQKSEAVLALLLQSPEEPALLFVPTREAARDMAAWLQREGFAALALHGELEQRAREEVWLQFLHRSCSVLVATDVAARGLHVEDLPRVICWELPNDPEVHVHRTGRTGRAGAPGTAWVLCAPAERERAPAVEALLGKPLRWEQVPAVGPGSGPRPPPMVTLRVEGGRRDKLRPGDLLGAFGAELALPGACFGRITVTATRSYVSVRRSEAPRVLAELRRRSHKLRIKTRTWRVGLLEPTNSR
jgi:ATP-independent RNA helicase DbpA